MHACSVNDFVYECGSCCDNLDQPKYCSGKAYFTAVENQLLVHVSFLSKFTWIGWIIEFAALAKMCNLKIVSNKTTTTTSTTVLWPLDCARDSYAICKCAPQPRQITTPAPTNH